MCRLVATMGIAILCTLERVNLDQSDDKLGFLVLLLLLLQLLPKILLIFSFNFMWIFLHQVPLIGVDF